MPTPKHAVVLVTCEHASAAVPRRYAALFRSKEATRALETHEGSDLGARKLARRLASAYGAECYEGVVTRLLIDLNRSRRHPQVFSRFSRALGNEERQIVLSRYYEQFRRQVHSATRDATAAGHRVIHLSVHSFTPVFNGETRNADLGLLYDPAREGEARLATHWKSTLSEVLPHLRVRRNYPYRGNADGHVTTLRRQFASDCYVGFEIEVNQQLLLTAPRGVLNRLVLALSDAKTVR